MNERIKIYIALQQDRDAVVLAAIHNGYAVRQGKELVGKKNIVFVEFWKETAV